MSAGSAASAGAARSAASNINELRRSLTQIPDRWLGIPDACCGSRNVPTAASDQPAGGYSLLTARHVSVGGGSRWPKRPHESELWADQMFNNLIHYCISGKL
jgi:hypothetical protein